MIQMPCDVTDVDLSRWTKPIPRDYQLDAHDSFFNRDLPACLIQLPTGTGKTLLAATIFSSMQGRCLFLAHTDELIRQTCRTMLRVGLWPNVEKAQEYQGTPYLPDTNERKKLFPEGYPPNSWFQFDKVTVASMQTFINRMDKYREGGFDLVVYDECFPAGTLVDGRPIEDIRVGDFVTAFNETTKRTIKRKVVRTFRKPAPPTLVTIRVGDIRLTATSNHPLLTSRGWVNAGNIKVGDSVYGLLKDVRGSRWEGRLLEESMVDCVEIQEQGSDGRYGPVCPDGYVYNIEVEGEHTYIANGFAVHNCHRARNATYESITKRMIEFNPQVRRLGVSATPYRADKKSLGKIFPEFAYRMDIAKAISLGYLVDVRAVQGTIPFDEKKLKRAGKDFSDQSVADAISSEDCIESIAHEIFEHGEGRRGIVFCPNIATTESVCAAINTISNARMASGLAVKPYTATFIHGKVPKKERRRRIRALEDDEYQLVVGCDALVEGFDVPDLSLAVMARLTGSRGRYEQMLGRVLRVLAKCIEGMNTAKERLAGIAASAKSCAKVLDFANTSRFKLISVEDILLYSEDEEKNNFIKKNRDKADPRKLQDQAEELEALYALREAIRSAGEQPPKLDYQYQEVNLFGGGTTTKKTVGTKDAGRPSSDQILLGEQFFIESSKSERMTSRRLSDEIEKRKERMCGRRNYGFLMGLGIDPKEHSLNWHDATYLRKLVMSRPDKSLPENWSQLVSKKKSERQKGELQ